MIPTQSPRPQQPPARTGGGGAAGGVAASEGTASGGARNPVGNQRRPTPSQRPRGGGQGRRRGQQVNVNAGQSGGGSATQTQVKSIDLKRRLRSTAILFVLHGETFWGKSAMFGNSQKIMRRVKCANCIVSISVSDAMSFFD